MAAPPGNQFWKLRSKHGRDKIFSSPEMLWDAAAEYFEWVDSHPWVKSEAIKSGEMVGQIMKVPTERPYTLAGLCIYLDVSSRYFIDFKNSLAGEAASDPPVERLSVIKDFSQVITRIEEVIYTQKFEGAAVGAFNPNIIARDLGLVDKQQTEQTGSLSVVMTKDEAKEISDALDKEV